MRRDVSSNGSIFETFADFSEFFNTCDGRKNKGGSFHDSRTRYDDDDDWAGANYDQAREMLLHGYDKSVSAVNSKVNQLQRQSFEKPPHRIKDYCGFAPIVPAYVIGLPKTMWNNKKDTPKSKVVTVVYDVGVSCGVSARELEEHGARVVSYIMNLERLGYRVRIDAMDGFAGGGKAYALRIPIKNENNPINLKRICFPMTHVAFSRTLAFDWYERCPDAKYMGGYGTPIYAMRNDERKEILDQVLTENEYYINYKLEPEDVFSDFAEELGGGR